MDAPASSRTRWRTSSHSGSNGNCVQVARTGTMIAVRDSADSTGPVLTFAPRQWTAFTAAVTASAGLHVTGMEDHGR
jgi:hypothetical protein